MTRRSRHFPVATVEQQISDFSARIRRAWERTGEQFVPPGEAYEPDRQREEESRLREFISRSEGLDSGPKRSTVRKLQRLKASVRAKLISGVPEEQRSSAEEMLHEFSDAGDHFVRDAGQFDPSLSPDDIFQALRNLWILNSLQAAYALPVCMSAPGFAYSLMYPYTDNYLDDDLIAPECKKEFNEVLTRRLSGSREACGRELPSRLGDLLKMVEQEYPRAEFPEVYDALLGIQRGQERSLIQQSGEAASPEEILAISVDKGGCSVLADGYLCKGKLSSAEAWFAFRFGVSLQFIDDLQDVERDREQGHTTLFTLAARRGTLDGLTNRLIHFQQYALDTRVFRPSVERRALFSLMHNGCRGLILQSVAQSTGQFSPGYANSLERYSPVRFGFVREMETEVRARERRLREAFKGRAQRGARRMAALSSLVAS